MPGPMNPEAAALMQRARQEMAQGRYESALPILQEAIHCQPMCAELHTLLGIAYAQLQRNTEALQAFQRAMALDLGNPCTHYNYAMILDRVGRTYEAVHELQEALKLDPHYHAAEKMLEEIQARITSHYHPPWET